MDGTCNSIKPSNNVFSELHSYRSAIVIHNNLPTSRVHDSEWMLTFSMMNFSQATGYAYGYELFITISFL
jgi:hypothetical protein